MNLNYSKPIDCFVSEIISNLDSEGVPYSLTWSRSGNSVTVTLTGDSEQISDWAAKWRERMGVA
jgi:hypothetical protein